MNHHQANRETRPDLPAGGRVRRVRSFIWILPLLAALFCFQPSAFGQGAALHGTVTISDKLNNSTDSLHPNGAVLGGKVFTYRLAYSYSGWSPGDLKLIEIKDIVPYPLAIWSVSNPSGTYAISGNIVSFYVTAGLGGSCGAGTVDINVYFRNDSTCNGTRVCNNEVELRDSSISKGMSGWFTPRVSSCAKDSATNNWSITKRHIICSYGDSVLYQIGLYNSRQLGSLELRNVVLTDALPPGATMGAVVSTGVNTWTGVSGTSGTVTFAGGPTTCGSQIGWYYVNFWVHYPIGSFTAGQPVTNSTTCTFTLPCDTSRHELKNGDQTNLCDFLNDGVMSKNFSLNLFYPTNPWSLPSIAPGCCGVYTVGYTNTGTVRQTPVTITDDIPSTVDVNEVDVPVPTGMSATLEWEGATGGWQPASPVAHTSTFSETSFAGITGQVRHLRWVYTSTNSTSLAQGAGITSYIHVCFDPSLTNQNVVNVASVDAVAGTTHFLHSITNTLTPDPLAPKIIARKFFIGNCPAGPNGPWYPGNTVRWRIAVANVGNQDATNWHITDVLPAGMTYAGNPKYEVYSTMAYPGIGWNTPSCSDPNLSALPPAVLGTQQQVPAIGDATVNWKFTNLKHNCTGTVDWLIIDFDVKISDNPMMLAGTYPNNYQFTASNITGIDSSNYAYVTINTVTRAEATKLVGLSAAGPFSDHVTLAPGGTGYYQLTVKNTGNVPLLNLSLLDILPHVSNDITVIGYQPRGSLFSVLTNGAITSTPSGWSPGFSTPSNVNPDRQAGFVHFCGLPNPPGATAATWSATSGPTGSFVLSGASLPPAQTLTVTVPFKADANGHSGDTACNNFAWQAQAGGTIGLAACMFAESLPACITLSSPCVCPCDTGKMEPALNHNNDLQFDWKTFTIFNLHCSPIDSINLQYYDATTGALLTSAPPIGGSLYVYRDPSGSYYQGFSKFNNSDTYHHMPLPHGTTLATYGSPATQDRVSFELGLNMISTPANWKVVAIVYHQNGDTCRIDFPTWTPAQPSTGTGVGGGRLTGEIYALPFDLNLSTFKPTAVGYVTATTSDSTELLGGTAAQWQSDSTGGPRRPTSVEQTSSSILFKLSTDPKDQVDLMHLVVFARMRDSNDTKTPPTVHITLYDANSNRLSTLLIRGTQKLAVNNAPAGAAIPTNDLVITSVAPNPARNMIEVHYHLDATEDMQLELYNTLGAQVGVLAQGYETRGDHTAQFVVNSLPEGSYILRLSTRFGQASSSVRIVR